MSDDYPGELEQMLLLSILRLGDAAYGLRIREELTEVTGREPSSGALYTTLDRMERKGMVTSRQGERPPDRGGRPRRYFLVTDRGREALQHARRALLALWDGVTDALDGT